MSKWNKEELENMKEIKEKLDSINERIMKLRAENHGVISSEEIDKKLYDIGILVFETMDLIECDSQKKDACKHPKDRIIIKDEFKYCCDCDQYI